MFKVAAAVYLCMSCDYCCRWNYELRDAGNFIGTAKIAFENFIGMGMKVIIKYRWEREKTGK